MLLNLHTLTSIIQFFCHKHHMINSVFVANEIDFRAVSNSMYPVVNIEPQEANLDVNQLSQSFVITVADIMNPNFKGENNFRLIDGCQRIAQDIIIYLQNQYEFDASTLITLNQFEDEGTDRTAGVVFRINLIYSRDTNTCILEDVVSLPTPFCINIEDRAIVFSPWLLYPFRDAYEITLDGGQTWISWSQNVYELGDEEIPAFTLGQRLKSGSSINTEVLWNTEVIPAI